MTEYEPTVEETEIILRLYPQLKAYAEIIERHTSNDLPRVPRKGDNASDPTHEQAARREVLVDVCRVVEKVFDSLAPDEKQIIRLRYYFQRPWKEVSGESHISQPSLFRKREALIPRFARALGLLGAFRMGRFWDYYESNLRVI